MPKCSPACELCRASFAVMGVWPEVPATVAAQHAALIRWQTAALPAPPAPPAPQEGLLYDPDENDDGTMPADDADADEQAAQDAMDAFGLALSGQDEQLLTELTEQGLDALPGVRAEALAAADAADELPLAQSEVGEAEAGDEPGATPVAPQAESTWLTRVLASAAALEVSLQGCFGADVPLKRDEAPTVMHLLLALVAVKIRTLLSDNGFSTSSNFSRLFCVCTILLQQMRFLVRGR